jgi:hypothetical protein
MTRRPTPAGEPGSGAGARHIPVLLSEVVTSLAPKAGETYIDATFGAGRPESIKQMRGAELRRLPDGLGACVIDAGPVRGDIWHRVDRRSGDGVGAPRIAPR